VQDFFDFLTALPPAALYVTLAVTAAIENVFPPLPSDAVVAFGSFIAARGHASVVATFLSTWAGNLSGAMLMYWLGRRYGAERLTARMARSGEGQAAEQRIRAWYGRHGLWAIAASRFLPAARALVPPVAGALRVPPGRAALAMGIASAVWYGAITAFAFTVGDRWEELAERVSDASRLAGYVAIALAGLALAYWLVRRRRARQDAAP
jgi:membrane protein DedA with SNARE-associated domain